MCIKHNSAHAANIVVCRKCMTALQTIFLPMLTTEIIKNIHFVDQLSITDFQRQGDDITKVSQSMKGVDENVHDKNKHSALTSRPAGSTDVPNQFFFFLGCIYSAEIKICKCIIFERIAVLWQTVMKLNSVRCLCVCHYAWVRPPTIQYCTCLKMFLALFQPRALWKSQLYEHVGSKGVEGKCRWFTARP